MSNHDPSHIERRIPAGRRAGRALALVLPAVAVFAMPIAGCESEGDPSPSSVVGEPADVGGDDSTTSSLPESGYTAPPNPNAGGGDAPSDP